MRVVYVCCGCGAESGPYAVAEYPHRTPPLGWRAVSDGHKDHHFCAFCQRTRMVCREMPEYRPVPK